MRGWDDFIVEDSSGSLFTVPTVPLIPSLLKPFLLDATRIDFIFDDRVQGKIKWYVTPIVFGGDPILIDNMAWVTLEQHSQLVKWWNEKYRELKAV